MAAHILVVRFSSLGDIILTSPALINLKIAFPGSRITYLTKERYRSVVSMIESVDEIVTVSDSAGLLELSKTAWKLDHLHFSHMVDLHGNMRSSLARKLISSHASSVYPKRNLERYNLVRTKYIPRHPWHVIDQYNQAVRQLGGRPYAERPMLTLSDTALSSVDLPADRTIVGIAPGAAHLTKQWPLDRFLQTAERLRERHDYRIAWILVREDADQITKRIPPDTDLLLVDRPIEQAAAAVARCKVLISNDSGIAHLGSAVGTPVVSIFGPTHPALGFEPRGLYDRLIDVDEPCRPCSRHGKKPCYRDEQFCFTRIEPARVAETVVDLLSCPRDTEKAMLIDRDGTLLVNRHYPSDPSQIEFVPGGLEAIRAAKEGGFRIILVSNQSGVARGFFSLETAQRFESAVLEQMARFGAAPDASYFCPHHPDGSVPEFTQFCRCRKPGPGMAEEAAQALAVDLRKSWVIGDSMDDLNFARVVGARPVLVRTGHGSETETLLDSGPSTWSAARYDNLPDAIRHALSAP